MKEKTWRNVIFIVAACLFAISWFTNGVDIDAYYMVAQGREILRSGVPHVNNWSFVPDLAIVLQQWVYCVIMAWAAMLPNNIGLFLLMLIQAMAMYAVYVKLIAKNAKTSFQKTVSMLAAVVIMFFIVGAYHISLRPENLTMLLIVFQCYVLNKYRDTGKKSWLLFLPLITCVEANFHASMIVFHFCVMAAYCIRLPDKRVTSDRIKLTPWVAGITVLSTVSTLLNPYGLEGVLYAPNSMGIFEHLMMKEQDFVRINTFPGIMLICVTCAVAWLYGTGKLNKSSELNLCLGFTVLSFTSYHGNMMLPLVACICLSKIIPSINGEKISDFVKNHRKNMRLVGISCFSVLILLTCTAVTKNLPRADVEPDMSSVVEFLDQREKGNVLNYIDTGSYLEYHGYTGLFGDTRPELLYYKINDGWHGEEVSDWLAGCTPTQFVIDEYGGNPETFLDRYDIRYVIDNKLNQQFGYVDGYMDGSGKWDRYDLSEIDEKCPYIVWVRKETPR